MGRVFPDLLAGCQHPASEPCSPNAQGNVPAAQFIQYGEFVDALKCYDEPARGVEALHGVWPLDGKLGDGSGTGMGSDAFPATASGSWSSLPRRVPVGGPADDDLERKKSDVFVVRVTDESVPTRARSATRCRCRSTGIERAGVEGGTRAMEDLVTAATTGKAARPVVPASVEAGAPSFSDVLKKTIYFTYPNPDGWRRGSTLEGGVLPAPTATGST